MNPSYGRRLVVPDSWCSIPWNFIDELRCCCIFRRFESGRAPDCHYASRTADIYCCIQVTLSCHTASWQCYILPESFRWFLLPQLEHIMVFHSCPSPCLTCRCGYSMTTIPYCGSETGHPQSSGIFSQVLLSALPPVNQNHSISIWKIIASILYGGREQFSIAGDLP